MSFSNYRLEKVSGSPAAARSTYAALDLAGVGSRAALGGIIRAADPGVVDGAVTFRLAVTAGASLAVSSLLDETLDISASFVSDETTAGELFLAIKTKAESLGFVVYGAPLDPDLVLSSSTDTTGESTVDSVAGTNGTFTVDLYQRGRSGARTLSAPEVHVVTEDANLPSEIDHWLLINSDLLWPSGFVGMPGDFAEIKSGATVFATRKW